MDTPFSLYIDHQNIAPLVRLLENTVETCREEQQQEYQPHQIRMTLYQEFLSILHNLYLTRNPQIKFENGQIKLEDQICPKTLPNNSPYIEGLTNTINAPTLPKKTRGLSTKNLQVEMQLIQWIQSCDKRIFEKKEIDSKYQQLVGDTKKSINLKKIKQIVEKFNFHALIVKTRNKQEHFFGVDLNASVSNIPKKQQNSLNDSVWLDDDTVTLKNSIQSLPQQIKEQSSSQAQSSLDIRNMRMIDGQVMAQQQSQA